MPVLNIAAYLRILRQVWQPRPSSGFRFKIIQYSTKVIGGITVLVATIELSWTVSSTSNVTSQVLSITQNGVSDQPITLEPGVTTHTVDIPASTDVVASLTAVNVFGSSEPAKLSFTVPDLAVPASPVFANPGWEIKGVHEQA